MSLASVVSDRVPPAHGVGPASAQLVTEIERIVAAQRAHAPVMAATTPAERRARLRRLARAIDAHRSEIAQAIHDDFRRPHAETDLVETYTVLAEINHAVAHLGRWMRPVRTGTPLLLFGTSSRVTYEPRGVALILAPWNYPFSLVINPLVAAIAAGNCAVCKPSEKTPHTSRLIKTLLESCGDPREVAVVEGGPEVAEALLRQPFDHIFFTGSTQIGRVVMAAAARHLASVTLELGGKSPAIVDASADLEAAAARIAWGKFVNAGQTCVAPDYVLVQEAQHDAFVAALTRAIARLYGTTEDERQASPDLARIVDEAHYLRLADVLERAVGAGARVAIGGRMDRASRYVAPTVLTDVCPDSPAMQGEIFGPILPVLGYRDTAEAVTFVRSREKPLSLYVFSRDERATRTLLAGTSAGGTTINNTLLHYGNPALPFGGVGASGLGAYHGVHGFRAFSHARPIVRQREPAFTKFFFPPYGRRLTALGLRLLRLLQ